MKAKLVFIEVEESRLYIVNGQIYIACLGTYVSKATGNQPIKPVLIGEFKIEKPVVGELYYISGFNRIEKCTSINNDVWRFQSCVLGEDKQLLHKILKKDTEELHEQIAKGELVEGVWYEFAQDPRTKEEDYNKDGSINLNYWGKLSRPLKVVSDRKKHKSEIFDKVLELRDEKKVEQFSEVLREIKKNMPDVNEDRVKKWIDNASTVEWKDQTAAQFVNDKLGDEGAFEPDEVTKLPTFKIDGVDVLSWDDNMKENPFSHMCTFIPEGPVMTPIEYWHQARVEEVPETNEVTEEECQELINELDQFSRDYDPYGYALPTFKDEDNPNQQMIEIVKKWAIERMNKPPQDTTSQESKDY